MPDVAGISVASESTSSITPLRRRLTTADRDGGDAVRLILSGWHANFDGKQPAFIFILPTEPITLYLMKFSISLGSCERQK